MGSERTPGLVKRGKYWHVEKRILGQRIRESTGTASLREAQQYLARKIEEVRKAAVYGVRPKRSFLEAATKFLVENQHKRSIHSDACRLKVLAQFIGELTLDTLHMGSLQSFITARRQTGIKTRTINHGLQIVRRILNLAATEWVDEHGLMWLMHAPKIKLLPEHDLRKPYPLSWEEQARLFRVLPQHLERMALFTVSTGCRDQEVCKLRWEWEIKFPKSTKLSAFLIPSEFVKNGDDRLIVCNDVAQSVVNSQRGQHAVHVFHYLGQPMGRMLSSAWCRARKKAGLPQVRVHDLKHTFGRRLRAVGVSFEDRQDLLGYRSGRITTHYSTAELENLYQAANKVCHARQNGLALTLIKIK